MLGIKDQKECWYILHEIQDKQCHQNYKAAEHVYQGKQGHTACILPEKLKPSCGGLTCG